MTLETLSAWILAAMIQIAPPDRLAAVPTFPEAQETAEERLGRYGDIADDLAAEVAQAAPEGQRRNLAALLVAIAWHESGFARDVDLGPCAPGRVRRGGCDGGRARTLFQLQAYEPKDRREAAAIAIRLVRRSYRACASLPREEQLASYAAGNCRSSTGRAHSRAMVAIARRLLELPPQS